LYPTHEKARKEEIAAETLRRLRSVFFWLAFFASRKGNTIMNGNNRFQPNRNQSNGFHNRSQYSNVSVKQTLEREIRQLEGELIAVDCQIDALGEKGRLLQAAKDAHIASVPLAIAQVAFSTLGLRFLPPVAREWNSKYQQYLRAEENLRQYALSLDTRRKTICAQLYRVETELEMLQYQP
jgi:hypothetical protein